MMNVRVQALPLKSHIPCRLQKSSEFRQPARQGIHSFGIVVIGKARPYLDSRAFIISMSRTPFEAKFLQERPRSGTNS